MSRFTWRLLDLAVAAIPHRPAATLGDAVVTFQEIDRRANQTARALVVLGLERGDRVLFWGPTSLRMLDVYWATQRIGAAFTPINPVFSEDEAAGMGDYVQPRLIVVDAVLQAAGEALAKRLGVTLAVIGGNGPVPGHDLDALSARAEDEPFRAPDLDEEDIHAIFLTSGSTGVPKGVCLSHRASWLRAYGGNMRGAAGGGGGTVCMFPFFHWSGWHFLMDAWANYRPCHLTHRADPELLLSMIERWRAGHIYCIPLVWQRMLECQKPFDTSSLKVAQTGTYRFDPSLVEALRQRFPGTTWTIHMGATEFGLIAGLHDTEIACKPYSVGLPMPGVEARIVDDELVIRGDAMMSGYYNLPDLTRSVMQGGWYWTGDLAERDADGYYSVTGRRREIIRTGGETVAPAEVEAALIRHPAIAEVAVVGLPDLKWGETVCAAVVAKEGAPLPSVEELKRHLGALAGFKHPRIVIPVDSLPRTPATGQIQRGQIRDAIIADMQRERAQKATA